MVQPYKKVNSFSSRPSAPQIVSYVLVGLQISTYFACIDPAIQTYPLRLALTISYTAVQLVVICSTAICSSVDPVDPVVVELRRKNKDDTFNVFSIGNHQNGEKSQKTSSNAEKAKADSTVTRVNPIQNILKKCSRYCERCHTMVQEKTKHCRVCNRCVADFDHHCVWINNCIGGTNYRYFACMIASTACQIVLYMTGAVISFGGQEMTCKVMTWTTCSLVLLAEVGLCYLIIFHLYLTWHNLTTFEFQQTKVVPADSNERGTKNSEAIVKTNEAEKTQQFILDALNAPIPKINQIKNRFQDGGEK